jgi:hypothetical protein
MAFKRAFMRLFIYAILLEELLLYHTTVRHMSVPPLPPYGW